MISKRNFFLALLFFILQFLSAGRILCAGTSPKAADNLALFITGLPGNNQFKIHIHQAAKRMREVLRANGYRAQQIVLFSEAVESGGPWGRNEVATKEKIQEYLKDMRKRHKAYDQVFVFIVGHANGHDEEAMFHLPGPDIAYQDLMKGIDGIPAKEMMIIVIAPQGHVWIRKLGRPGRVIIAGNGLRQFDFIPMLFLRYFPENLWRGVADPSQKKERLVRSSLRDVFMQTQKDVQNWYRLSNLHPTEVALIDADGDGKAKSLISKGVEFDAWAKGERKAKEVLEAVAESPALPNQPASVKGQEKAKEISQAGTEADSQDVSEQRVPDLPMDIDLPDAKAAQSFIFLAAGGKSHGR